jgi:hypothetical protein
MAILHLGRYDDIISTGRPSSQEPVVIKQDTREEPGSAYAVIASWVLGHNISSVPDADTHHVTMTDSQKSESYGQTIFGGNFHHQASENSIYIVSSVH